MFNQLHSHVIASMPKNMQVHVHDGDVAEHLVSARSQQQRSIVIRVRGEATCLCVIASQLHVHTQQMHAQIRNCNYMPCFYNTMYDTCMRIAVDMHSRV